MDNCWIVEIARRNYCTDCGFDSGAGIAGRYFGRNLSKLVVKLKCYCSQRQSKMNVDSFVVCLIERRYLNLVVEKLAGFVQVVSFQPLS